MGMSTSVVGYRDPDEKWLKMKQIYDLCKENNIRIPEDVEEFFDYEEPTDNGIKVYLENIVEQYSPYDCAEGWKVEIAKLPKNIKYVCFINSY